MQNAPLSMDVHTGDQGWASNFILRGAGGHGEGEKDLGGTTLGKLKHILCSHLFLESKNRAFAKIGAKPLCCIVPDTESVCSLRPR